MQKEKKKRKRNNEVWHTILLALCGLILGLNIYSTNAKTLVGNQIPMPFGYGAAVVLSGSMEPELSKGDLILVKEINSYNTGEIVVFQDINYLVVHRIIRINETELITKGDANNMEDSPIEISSVKGKVIFWIPFIGHLINFLKTGPGIVLTLLSAFLLNEIPRRRERQKGDEEREKILAEIERLRKEI